MKITEEQVRLAIESRKALVEVPAGTIYDKDIELSQEGEMIRRVRDEAMAMPDREEMVAKLKEQVEKGEFNPSAEEIVDALVRREAADGMR